MYGLSTSTVPPKRALLRIVHPHKVLAPLVMSINSSGILADRTLWTDSKSISKLVATPLILEKAKILTFHIFGENVVKEHDGCFNCSTW